MAKKAVTPSIDAGTLAVDYNFAVSVMNSDPQLKDLFAQAVAQTWSGDKFVAMLRGTKWFQRTSDTARQWAILAASDPATAKQRVAARQATLLAETGQLGITMSAAQLKQLTDQTLMFGWTDDQVRQSVAKNWRYDAKTPTAGLAGQTVDALKKAANDYLVPISDSTIQAWTQKVLAGTATPADFTEYAKQQATSLFPSLAHAINDQGLTVQQYADPYKQQAAQTLGINPDDIDFTQDKWRSALDQVDPKTQQHVPMTLADWTSKIKTDSQYGYDTTSGARDQASQLVAGLSQMFGFQG